MYILFMTIFPIFPPISQMKFAEIIPEDIMSEDIMSPKIWDVEEVEIELERDQFLNEF